MSIFNNVKIDSKDFVDLLKLAQNDVVWLFNNNKMYLWRTEDTMEKLEQDRCSLEYMMEGVAFNMEKALSGGWWQLNPGAKAWLKNGLAAIEMADKVQSKYNKDDHSTDGNILTSILLCPCETVSFRMLNARAIRRRHNINGHMAKGIAYEGDIEYKDFALKKRANDSRLMDAQAISSFCAAQEERHISDRIRALLDLPRSVLEWTNQEHKAPPRVKRSKTPGMQLEAPRVIMSRPRWGWRAREERRSLEQTLPLFDQEIRVQPIESECSESLLQVEEATQASDVKEMEPTLSATNQQYFSLTPNQYQPPITSQSSVFSSQNKSAPATDHQPSEQTVPMIQPESSKSLRTEEASDAQKIQLSHFVNYSAFPRSQRYDSVPVLIRAKAPRYTRRPRAPIDLVVVLGICGSVDDDENKLEQLKQGCKFVVHNLEAKDRLSIVASSNDGKPTICFPLTYMTDDAKRSTNQLIAFLQPHGSADMVTEAIKLADEALRGQCVVPDDDRVGSIMFLSDGELTTGGGEDSACAENCITYTMGLGRGHDPCTLYAAGTRGHGHGTYSFVADNSYEKVREAMAMYIGGLTSITARDVEICIRSAHPAVHISGISYVCSVEDEGKSRRISLNNLYASEEKSFIVFVDVPVEEAAGGSIFSGTPKTKLLSVTASYCCPVTRARVGTDPIEISVERPRWARALDGNISVEVASEVLRTKVFNGINEIWSQGIDPTAAAKDVAGKLASLRKDIEGTNEAKAAKDVWLDLCEDLDHMQEEGGSSDDELYMKTDGLPYMLSWLSSQRSQRAATPGSSSKSRSLNFRTTRMQNMIDSVDTAPSAYIE